VIVTILRWALAIIFIVVGLDKLRPSSIWPAFFEDIWLGDPLRYFTVAMEVIGGLLLLSRRTVTVGLVMLGMTMVGAMATWVLIIGQPSGAWKAAVLLGALILLGLEHHRAVRPS
jgi:uncharacterized membrane protein YphA (DoxX/SURF4 family)